MIKILLKHKLIEIAINTFFKQVSQNFDSFKAEGYFIGRKIECILTSMQSITRENVVTQKWYYGVEIIEIPVEGCITISAAEVEKSIFNFNPNGEIEDEVTTNDFDVIRVIAIENITTVYEYDQDYSND